RRRRHPPRSRGKTRERPTLPGLVPGWAAEVTHEGPGNAGRQEIGEASPVRAQESQREAARDQTREDHHRLVLLDEAAHGATREDPVLQRVERRTEVLLRVLDLGGESLDLDLDRIAVHA